MAARKAKRNKIMIVKFSTSSHNFQTLGISQEADIIFEEALF